MSISMVSCSKKRRLAEIEHDRKLNFDKDNFCKLMNTQYNIEKDTCLAIQTDFRKIYSSNDDDALITGYNQVCDIQYFPQLKFAKFIIILFIYLPMFFAIYSFCKTYYCEIAIITILLASNLLIFAIALHTIEKVMCLIY
jgi:hypothetical protein